MENFTEDEKTLIEFLKENSTIRIVLMLALTVYKHYSKTQKLVKNEVSK